MIAHHLTRPEERFQPYRRTAFDRPQTADPDPSSRLAASEAEAGSYNLRVQLLRYGAKNGLPNLSGLQCLSELKLLGEIRAEELALADRIEAELNRPSKLKEMDW